MGAGDNSGRTRSQAGLDADQYKLLLEVELRMNDKLEKQYEKLQTHIVSAVKAAIDPVKEQLVGMEKRIDRRFDEGTEQFRAHERRLSEHSDQLEANSREIVEAKRLLAERHKDCPMEKGKEPETNAALTKKSKKESLFTRKDLLMLLLTVLSPLITLWVLAQIKLIAFTDTSTSNPVVQPSTPQPPGTHTP